MKNKIPETGKKYRYKHTMPWICNFKTIVDGLVYLDGACEPLHSFWQNWEEVVERRGWREIGDTDNN